MKKFFCIFIDGDNGDEFFSDVYAKSAEEKSAEKAEKENPVYVANFVPTEFYGKRLSLPHLYGIAAYRAQVGYYIKPNYDDALRWAELGALKLDTASLSFMGSVYYTGRGVKQDYKMAMDYFKKSPTINRR